jgi:hypothetical protein
VKRITPVLVSAAALAVMFLAGRAASVAPAHVAGGHAAAPATRIQTDNAPCDCNTAVVEPEDNLSQYGWVDGGTGYLMANGYNDTEFRFQSNGELEIFTGKYAGECLYYNADGGDYDPLACDASKKSDLWEFGDTSHTYSEWQSLYDTAECVWYGGAGQAMEAAPCDGTNDGDHWYWVVPTCQPDCNARPEVLADPDLSARLQPSVLAGGSGERS